MGRRYLKGTLAQSRNLLSKKSESYGGEVKHVKVLESQPFSFPKWYDAWKLQQKHESKIALVPKLQKKTLGCYLEHLNKKMIKNLFPYWIKMRDFCMKQDQKFLNVSMTDWLNIYSMFCYVSIICLNGYLLTTIPQI